MDGGYAESTTYFLPVTSAGMQASVDAAALTLEYQTFRIQSAATTLSRNVSITSGFGATKNYNLKLNLDPVIYQITDGVPSHGLSAATGGNYTIQNTGNLNYVTAITTTTVTGSYTIVGPTETVTGTFAIPASGTNYMIVPDTINTSNFPAQLTFSHTNNQFHTFLDFLSGASVHLTPTTNDNYFINTTVDGENVTWGFWRMHFSGNFGTTSPGALAAIPEPGIYAGMSIGALFLVTVFARRRGRDSGH